MYHTTFKYPFLQQVRIKFLISSISFCWKQHARLSAWRHLVLTVFQYCVFAISCHLPCDVSVTVLRQHTLAMLSASICYTVITVIAFFSDRFSVELDWQLDFQLAAMLV